jgi:hypothetical protein
MLTEAGEKKKTSSLSKQNVEHSNWDFLPRAED